MKITVRSLFMMFVFACALFAISAETKAQEEVMTNDEVISLTKAGLNKSIIINKIKTSKTAFDLSTNSLIKLKEANVDDDIVTAMLEAKSGKVAETAATGTASGDPNDPMSPHSFGIYLYHEKDGKKIMTQLTPTVSAQNRIGGLFTSGLTYGLSKVKIKSNLPGTTASLQVSSPKPVFYLYLDTKSGGLNTSSGVPSTPNEFAMVKFNIRSDNREVTIGKINIFGGKGGLSDEYVMAFDAEDLGNGVFKVTPKADLKNGEYAFYLINSGNSNTSSGVGSKFFDFGVKLTP